MDLLVQSLYAGTGFCPDRWIKETSVPRYQYDVSVSRQKRFLKRSKELTLVLLGLLVFAGALVVADSMRQSSDEKPVEGQPTVSVVGPSQKEFSSAYFAFKAPSSWTNIAAETTGSKFVYRSYRGQLVEQELAIYINSAPSSAVVTRVLPVRVEEGGKHMIPGDMSEHCSKAAGTAVGQPVAVTMDGVHFVCQVDSTNYLAAVGVRGGGIDVKLTRADGSSANYNFIYRCSTVLPDSAQLVDIINSFVPY